MTPSDRLKGYPTVLIAEEDPDRRHALVHRLQQDGYLVLEADGCPSIVNIARTHSRPIHLLLISGGMDDRALAAALKSYRPDMTILFVGHPSDVLTPDIALGKVRAFFRDRKAQPTSAAVEPLRSFKAAG